MKIIILLCSFTIVISFAIWLCGFDVNNLWYIVPAIIIAICGSVLLERRHNANHHNEPNFHSKKQIQYFKGRKTYHDWQEWYDNDSYKNN